MAVMAASAIIGTAGVTAGVVTVQTVAMIALGATVVGVATKSKLLMKIGAGLGLGAGASSLMGAGRDAVGAVAGAAPTTASPQGLVASAAAQPAAAAAPTSLASAGAAEEIVASAWTTAGQEVGTGTVLAPYASITAAETPVLNTSQATWGKFGLLDDSAAISGQGLKAPQAPALQNIGLSNIADKPTGFWNGLDSSGKLAVAQLGSGLISGVGQGMAAQEAADRQRFVEERDYRNRNYVPRFGRR